LIRFLDVQASFLATTGRYSEAESLWSRALRIGEKTYAGDSFQYQELFLHLGQAYTMTGDEKSAETMFRRFLAIRRPQVGLSVVTEAVVRAELARTYTNLQRFKEAEPLLLESVRVVESTPNKMPVAFALILSYFGDYYMARGRWAEAEVPYRKALKMREDTLGENAPDVAASMLSLSKALRKLHNKQEAEQLVERASCIMALQKDPLYTGHTIDVRALRQK
jgi:tetratricopeptide (TPR) repeat protein